MVEVVVVVEELVVVVEVVVVGTVVVVVVGAVVVVVGTAEKVMRWPAKRDGPRSVEMLRDRTWWGRCR